MLRLRIKYRILYFLEQLAGPYKKRDQFQLDVSVDPVLGKGHSEIFSFESLQGKKTRVNSHYLPLYLQAMKDGLCIHLPDGSVKGAVLKRATFWGWETAWNGADLTPYPSAETAGENPFEFLIPNQGWWRLTVPSTSVDLYYRTKAIHSPFDLRSFFLFFKAGIKNTVLQTFFIALVAHLALYYFIFSEKGIFQSNTIARILHLKTEEVPVVQEEAPGAAAVQVVAEPDVTDEPFQGIGFFAAIARKVEKSFQPTDVTSNLKKLTSLFKNPGVIPKLARPATAPSSQQQGLGLAASLKSLQSGLLAKGSAVPVAPPAQAKAPGVHWKPQFMTSGLSYKSGNAVTEAQQQKLLEMFGRQQDKFRGCYETALLKFDEMAVTVSFEGEVTPEGKIGNYVFNVTGRTTSDAKDSLLSCLKSVMGQFKLDPKLSGAKIKNQFIFKS